MTNEPAQAEEEQGVAYLDIRRNWLTLTHNMEGWIVDFNAFTGRVFFTKDGKIGMEQDGRVIVRRIEHWMAQERQEAPILEDDEPYFATGFTLPPDVVNAIVNKEEKEDAQ